MKATGEAMKEIYKEYEEPMGPLHTNTQYLGALQTTNHIGI